MYPKTYTGEGGRAPGVRKDSCVPITFLRSRGETIQQTDARKEYEKALVSRLIAFSYIVEQTTRGDGQEAGTLFSM